MSGREIELSVKGSSEEQIRRFVAAQPTIGTVVTVTHSNGDRDVLEVYEIDGDIYKLRPVEPDWPVMPTWINPVWTLPDDPLAAEPEPESPIPKPSSKVPFWAYDANKSRRPRKRRGQPNNQGIA